MFQPADGETEARGLNNCTITAFKAAREARLGKDLGLGWLHAVGPFPRQSTTLFTKWDTVSAECLHFAPLLPQRNSS